LAGEAFKKMYPDVRWLTYTVDPFYAGYKRGKKDRPKCVKALSVEKGVLSHADANFLSEEVYENSKELYSEVLDKTYPLPYLLPHHDHQADNRFDSNKINLVYTGRFYRDIRNPEYLLRTFLLTKNTDLVLHLYAASDCEKGIDEYVRQSSGRIVRHGLVDAVEIQKVINSADILVSVGNSIPEFKPSKTFEYIATGLPIINFYQNGLIDEVLERYSCALQIDSNIDNYDAAVEVKNFCIINRGKQMESSSIHSVFKKHVPNNIKNILIKVINRE
jgi:glycosyltransferase involved in cell wall biosynthesis